MLGKQLDSGKALTGKHGRVGGAGWSSDMTSASGATYRTVGPDADCYYFGSVTNGNQRASETTLTCGFLSIRN